MTHRGRIIALITSMVLALVAGGACLVLRERRSRLPPPRSSRFSTWRAPAFAFNDQDGRRIEARDLVGHAWIADFIFTRCTSACPMMTAKMVLLQRRIVDPSVRFVSFSVDPAHDTPEELKRYAARWHGDPARWHLLSTTPAGLRATAEAMHLTVQRSDDTRDPIIHSNRFLLIDAEGVVRGAYDSSDEGELAQLVADLARLSRAPVARAEVSTASTTGEGLFGELGCRACHADPALAPPLGGRFGGTTHLTDGTTRVVDAAYLREAITDPGATLVAGYQATMPSYRERLSAAQLAALTGYLETLKGQPSSTAPPVLVVDPVCKMKVSMSSTPPWAERAGTRYAFCSEACKRKFTVEASPDAPR